ncbi:proto-oncogene tyrosine-protein kinase receptor Ret [Parasteatoda tepidariorum]|uniref:proto-oncogene tyrosine-protein kinase receptor Ret n=1 Tax=Parasteatoda tepidariorum TaxID=114398 RepID=UPI0039BC7E14
MIQIFLNCLCFSLFIVTGHCLIFLQETISIQLPSDFPTGVTFYRLQSFLENSWEHTTDGFEFRITKSVIFPHGNREGRWLFSVDEHTGSLLLSPHRRKSIAEYIGSTFALDVIVVSTIKAYERPAHATIMIKVTGDNSSSPDCGARDELCFPSPEIQFQLPETIPKRFSLGSVKPIPFNKLCPRAVTKYSLPSNPYLKITRKAGILTTVSSFDYEYATSHEWNISCEVKSGTERGTFMALLQIMVIDVDDNAPYVQNSTSLFQEIDVSQVIPGKPLPLQLTVLDPDTASVNDITVQLNDPLQLFSLKDPVVFHGVNKTNMLINTALVPKAKFHFPEISYNVTVTFNDTHLITKNEDSYIEFHVQITNKTIYPPSTVLEPKSLEVVASIFRHSSQHARIVQPMEVHPHDGYFFRLLGEPSHGLPSPRIFGVTPATGIIYLKDEVTLSRNSVNLYKLELTWRSREAADRQCNVLIRVVDTGDPRSICGVEPGHHFQSCSSHGTAENCTSSCGRGSVDGYCKWRPHSAPSLVSSYATCSPHLKTCPDGFCDELERLDPLLCPQDCAENIRGEAVRGSSGRGIGKSAAPCTCSGPNSCICLRPYPIKRKHKPSFKEELKTSNETHIKSYPIGNQDDWTDCGTGCKSMIVIVSLIVSGLIAFAGFLLYRRIMNKSKADGYPTITTPLNPLAQSNEFHVQDSHPLMRTRLCDYCAPEKLGDGSSSSEKRDMITELNLLKDIHHPNVIQLLCACTDDEGPLYLIMEYAENGALINFLKKMRSDDSDVKMEISELFSFALQIARGMDYLASVKVVHRDLAARNVLVSSDKVLKISDFGLSRDVYQEDAYRKSTKGKVPVKWMALESLQTNIYTTKSDVWSYGVLLWEIVTIGDTPYPGIPPERLFSMLKDGYRMPKPDNCPYHFYKIMRTCWREKPHERPHFRELVLKLESLMHELKLKNTIPLSEEECIDFSKLRKQKSENNSVMHQLTSFPKLSVVQIVPYENQHLLSPGEFSV